MLRNRLSLLVFSFIFASGLGLTVGCDGGEKKKKMEACAEKAKEMKDGDECKKCCEDAGASGHTWMNLSEASCSCSG